MFRWQRLQVGSTARATRPLLRTSPLLPIVEVRPARGTLSCLARGEHSPPGVIVKVESGSPGQRSMAAPNALILLRQRRRLSPPGGAVCHLIVGGRQASPTVCMSPETSPITAGCWSPRLARVDAGQEARRRSEPPRCAEQLPEFVSPCCVRQRQRQCRELPRSSPRERKRGAETIASVVRPRFWKRRLNVVRTSANVVW
jgi:hypothetical protein